MRITLSVLLTLGAVLGIGGGLARLHHGGRHHREHMMTRVAETCVEAARNLDRRDGAPHGQPGPGRQPGPHWAPPSHAPAAYGGYGAQPVFVPYPVPTAGFAPPAQPTAAPTPAE